MDTSAADWASLAGTWLGTLFTAVGLLAVFAQLRSILNGMTFDHATRMKKIAGDWAPCVLDKIPPTAQGIVEGAVPSFTAWLQRAYLEDTLLRTSQDDRDDCGRSGWSKLFSRLDIRPDALVAYGGSGRRADFPMLRKPRGINVRIRVPRHELGDVLAQNDSLCWGLAASDFAAIILLAGFRPWDFSAPGFSRSTSSRGRILLADFNPFSKIAKFDTLTGFHDASFHFHYDWQSNSDHLQQVHVPVGHCLQLAYGMIRTRPRSNREWIIFPEYERVDKAHEQDESALWTRYPSVSRLRYIQNVCEAFAGVTEVHVVDYVREHESHVEDDLHSLGSVLAAAGLELDAQDGFIQAKAREVMNVAFAVASLRPWGAIPVLLMDLTVAFRPVLEPFLPPRTKTVGALNAQLLKMEADSCRPPTASTTTTPLSPQQHIKFLSFVNGERKSFFDNASSCCRFYYEAMTTVFAARGIPMEEVRFALAAQVALSRLGNAVPPESSLGPCIAPMRALLGSKQSHAPPDWALDVYCGFLWGWITDSIPMDPLLVDRFPRRIFLG